MIKIMRYLFLLLIVINLAGCGKYVSVYFKAVDEDGTPVVKADVGVGYSHGYTWTSSGKVYEKTGITNETGIYHYTAHVPYRDSDIPGEMEDVFAAFKKEGYYRSYAQYIKTKDIDAGRWNADIDPMIILMRKKLKPVPMYARDTLLTKITIPTSDKEVGLDLIEFDWVAPYGKGEVADIVFKLHGSYENETKYDMQLYVTFPRDFDGIYTVREDISHGSMLKLLRYAPDSGYQKGISKYRIRMPNKAIQDNFNDLNNYYFRVRSEESKHALIRAMYGKVHGDIKFYPKSQSSATIVFKYYLNPDYTRNMEFGANIFKGLNVGIE